MDVTTAGRSRILPSDRTGRKRPGPPGPGWEQSSASEVRRTGSVRSSSDEAVQLLARTVARPRVHPGRPQSLARLATRNASQRCRNGLCRFHIIPSRATQPLAGLRNLRWGRDTRVGRGGQPFAMGRDRFAVFTLCDMLLSLCVQFRETLQLQSRRVCQARQQNVRPSVRVAGERRHTRFPSWDVTDLWFRSSGQGSDSAIVPVVHSCCALTALVSPSTRTFTSRGSSVEMR
jgi:hypothetical protein